MPRSFRTGSRPSCCRLSSWVGGVTTCGVLLIVPRPVVAQQPIIPAYKTGFPLVFAGDGNAVGSQPLAVDLGLSPGFKSIVFGLRNGKLYVVRRNSGGSWGAAPGWPQQLPAHIYSSPAVGDLDGDGIPDVVVGFGSVETQNSAHGGLRAYRRDGTLLWEVQTGDVTPGPANGFRDPVVSTPAIGDVDGDGSVEVIFGGLDHRLYVVNGGDGLSNNPAIWPRDMRDTVFSSPALFDVDGDGRLDIIIGSDAHHEGPPINTENGGYLHVLRFDGTEVANFPKYVNQVVSSSPAVGDIDGDGQPEIVHGTGNFWNSSNNPGNPPTHVVYAWNFDGSAVAGWPVAVDGQVVTSPVLANLNTDSALEVVVTADNSGPSGNFFVYAFKGNGATLFGPVSPRDFFGTQPALSAGEPMVADVLDDAALEILVPTNGEVAVFSAVGVQLTEDGPPYTNQKISFNTQASLGNVAVSDLETDGAGSKVEVIAVSAKPFPSFVDTEIHVWNPVSRTATPPWGFFRHDQRRRGIALDLIFSDGFETGNVSAWSNAVP